MREREIVFPKKKKKKIGKHPIENKPCFYQGFPLTKDSFPLTKFFFFFCATKYWKMWKTIYIGSFPMKQTERQQYSQVRERDTMASPIFAGG